MSARDGGPATTGPGLTGRVEPCPGEFWRPTLALRWVVRPNRESRVLEQAWQSDRGALKWEPVPETYGENAPESLQESADGGNGE